MNVSYWEFCLYKGEPSVWEAIIFLARIKAGGYPGKASRYSLLPFAANN